MTKILNWFSGGDYVPSGHQDALWTWVTLGALVFSFMAGAWATTALDEANRTSASGPVKCCRQSPSSTFISGPPDRPVS